MTIEERNKEIIELRNKRFTLQEIGDKFKISRERVRQIEVTLLKRTTMKNGKPLSQYTVYSPILDVKDIKVWNKRKRIALGLPENVKFNNAGGLDFVREIVRTRDGHRCQRCFIKWKEGQRRFDVHHLDPEKEGKSNERGSIKRDKQDIDEMITFCHKCHLSLPHLKEKMSKIMKKSNPLPPPILKKGKA